MSADVTPLIEHMRRFVSLTGGDEKIIAGIAERKKISNKEHLLQEGEVCRQNNFLARGCLRKYINTEDGDKQIFQFAIESWWMTDYTSLESGKPSTCNIQAVEDCDIIVISRQNLEALYQKVPASETYFRKILQRAYEASLYRIHLIFSYSGEQRYHSFSKAFPEFVQRIPQYMLASYLGFTPEFLSKLRAKKK